MAQQQYYGGVIWTNHALERLGQRGLTQDLAYQTFKHADLSFPAKQGGIEYQKKVGASKITIIAKQNEKREWIIISCWIDPPLRGTEDYNKQEAYRKYQKSSFLGKLWITFIKQLGF